MKKFIIKNVLIISIIMAFAMFTTYKIYYKFKNERNTDYTSASLEISFHEKQGNKISITKSSPVPDSIGLSSTAYTLTVTNNLTIPVKYKLILVPDENEIALDGCAGSQIPLDIVKVALKENKEPVEVFTLNEKEDNVIDSETIPALGTVDYTIRVWVTNSHDLTISNNLHYHSIIKVEEETK